ncbi:MAG: ABC transporter permease [Xanthomonadales bacterium]
MILRSLLAHYRRHPLQALFLLTGIVVANVLLVGTLLINAQARASYGQGERLLNAGPVAWIQHRTEGRSMDERDYIRLRRQGFDRIAPVLTRTVRAADGEPLEILGIDAFAFTGAAGDSEAIGEDGFGAFPFPPYRLWVAPGRLRQLGYAAGDRIPLDTGATLPPVQAVPGQQLGHRLLLDIGALQALTDSAGELSYVAVFAAPPERIEALRAALPEHLAWRDRLDAPDPAEMAQSFHLNLAAMGLLTFVVGIFLTYNALTFSFTDRGELFRRLRLAGVSRGELRRGLLLELGAFLAVGSLVGYWLGALLAARLLPGVGRTLAQLYDVYIDYPDTLLPDTSWLLPLAMTTIAALMCIAFPLRAALDTPLLHRGERRWQQRRMTLRDRRMALGGCALLVVAALAGSLATTLPLALAGMASLLLGAALLLPLPLRALLRALAALVPPQRARAAWLIADSRWLLGPASLALMAMTLALVANSGLNTMISSFRQATDAWLEQRLAAQLYVTARVDAGAVQAWLAARQPGARVVQRFRRDLRAAGPAGRGVPLEVVSLQAGERFLDSVDLIRAEPDARADFAAGDGLFISERAWRLDGWTPGDRVALCAGRPSVPLLGVYHDYGNPRSQWMASEALYRACWPDDRPAGLAVVGPAAAPWGPLRSALIAAFALDEGAVIDQQELKQIGLAVFDRTFTVTQALNALTLLVAGIGMFCAISAIHHHRVGYQALLASLGVSRRERGALLIAQWGLLGLLCMAVVWPFGAVLAAYLAGIVTPVAFGWSFPLVFAWGHYLELAATASGALVLAVLLPSIRLLRASPAALLREQAT